MKILINKVLISNEAIFDYEEIVGKGIMPKAEYRKELEEYFAHVTPIDYYLIKKYFDENLGKMLLLFFRRGMNFSSMQLWLLAGICDSSDYSEDIEEKGLIKNWLDNYIVA